MNYKLSYDFNKDKNCGVINFNDTNILIDFKDLFKIINHKKTFTRLTDDCKYPYYMRNKQKISYLQFLFNFKDTNIKYIFKNKNIYDLRRENISIVHKFHSQIKDKYEIIDYNLGHYKTNGKSAYAVKNPTWKIKDNTLLMYCELNTICKLCPVSYQKILDFEKKQGIKCTFYKHSNGYIATHHKNLFIHQIITGCYENGKGIKNISYIFKNKNIYDLRHENISIVHKFHSQIKDKYEIIDYNLGHYKTNGKSAYAVKNPTWKIKDNTLLMYCELNTICKLCPVSYQKILDFEKKQGIKCTFYKHSNGYIATHHKNLFIHQIITGCYGNGKGTKNISVDHIDQDPLNNRYDNLRIATRKEQEQNSKGIKPGTKKSRKKTAIKLPEGITQDMMPKYVYYCKECYNKEKQLFREFFRIEKHPKQEKIISSSKSSKLTILEKLADIKKNLYNLENDIVVEKELPPYYTIQNFRKAPHLVFDKRIDDKRYNLKMKMKPEKTKEEELERFNAKLKKKYPDLIK